VGEGFRLSTAFIDAQLRGATMPVSTALSAR
jgi:hypothetical protein